MRDKTREVMEIFEQISAIARCSKNEGPIADWISQWAQKNGFCYKKDNAGNLLIDIAAAPDCSDTPVIALQGHMDMVCEKRANSNHDFSKDPIKIVYDGDWVRAKETSLGADNGIGLALAMAVASDKTVKHPKLELLFTVDEETGLTGANAMEPGWLAAKILLNIDSEDDRTFTVGCAGGVDTHIELPVTFENVPEKSVPYLLKIDGLSGGHSGVDIHQQKANAVKLLARILKKLAQTFDTRIVSLNGGNAHNAIPRNSNALVAIAEHNQKSAVLIIKEFEKLMRDEYEGIEPGLNIQMEKRTWDNSIPSKAVGQSESLNIIRLLCAIYHGVYHMSRKVPGLVETSCNLATVRTKNSCIEIVTSQRSSTMSRLDEVTEAIESAAQIAGAVTVNKNDYPAWQPRMDSSLLKKCVTVYSGLFGEQPRIEMIHAGLECAVIGAKFPHMDMISFGPTIKGAHSPDEKLHLGSVKKIREFIEALLGSYAENS